MGYKTFKVEVKLEEIAQTWGTTSTFSEEVVKNYTDKQLAIETVKLLLKKMEEEI